MDKAKSTPLSKASWSDLALETRQKIVQHVFCDNLDHDEEPLVFNRSLNYLMRSFTKNELEFSMKLLHQATEREMLAGRDQYDAAQQDLENTSKTVKAMRDVSSGEWERCQLHIKHHKLRETTLELAEYATRRHNEVQYCLRCVQSDEVS